MNFKLSLCLALCFSAILTCDSQADIVNPKAPDGGRQVVRQNLNPKFLGVASIDDLTIADPHREYVVGLTNLAAGDLLPAAKPANWRYLLSQGSNTVGVATVVGADANTGKTLQFGALYETCFSTETLVALRAAEKMPQMKKQDYEPRFLNIPAVNFVAVWLHGKSDDIIIPLPPTFGRKLTAYEPYSESQILKVLQPEAKRVAKAPGLIR